MNQELSPETLIKFSQKLKDLDLNTEEFYYMPIHPWQWYNKMNPTFSSEIALQNIVLLGGRRLIPRTTVYPYFFNTSNPDKFYVKQLCLF